MKKILFFLLSVMSLFSCKEKTPDPGYYAGIAAKGYYDMLLEGRYDEFVEGQNMPIVFLKDIGSNWFLMPRCS